MKRPPENITDDRRKRKCVNNSGCEKSSSVFYEEGEFGVIESVTVQNFMCHENLTLNFEPHMNFIIGQNGSGKSAILTAIILALGGKSSSTDRFTNIKGFVKREQYQSDRPLLPSFASDVLKLVNDCIQHSKILKPENERIEKPETLCKFNFSDPNLYNDKG
ncbi:Structural maintenance of chromosomes protein 6 [Araneus ventricosus]|uniref:Structural maintenance of chromosomes protein 6 n=1 Tax=Araneus ventricosus TaxID=182803 RepID=A0A4Y2AA75_ARAVE|nr:Structural maintenance of chromosomes protein 6 [Araneus ventricosus]